MKNSHHLTITKNKTKFTLSFSDLDLFDIIFAKYDLISDGHTWERVIIRHCEDNSIDLSLLIFDCESDLFSVYSESRQTLEHIHSLISELITKPALLKPLLKQTPSENQETPEALLRDLKGEDYDLSIPIDLDFIILFNGKKQLKEACKEIDNQGYTCYYDNTRQVGLTIPHILPDLHSISEVFNIIQRITIEHNGKIVSFSHFEEWDEPFEELDGWKKFT